MNFALLPPALLALAIVSTGLGGFAQIPAGPGAPRQAASGPETTAQAPRLLKVSSGPSGKTVGDRFVLNEERNRFVIPQDKSLIVYMEFEGSPGDHKISGIWKRPDASTGFVSSDIEMISEGPRFNSYWTFYLNPGMEGGIWQFEALVDGTPVSAYSFEIVVPEAPASPVVEAKVAAKAPTLDDLYRLRTSLVWVHRLDELGHRLDTKSGFVVMEGVVATSFQAIDVADGIEVEFANERRAVVAEVVAYSATDDWALLKVNTDIVDAFLMLDSPAVSVGDRLVAFNAEAQATRVIGGLDYTGRRSSAKLERYVFSPGLSDHAMGGPLLDTKGNVIGLLSGCVAPGTRIGADRHFLSGVGARLCTNNTALPISAVVAQLGAKPVAFAALKKSGVITAPVRKLAAFLHGGTRRPEDAQAQKRHVGRLGLDDKAEFVQADGQVAVYSWWQHPENVKKHPPVAISAQVYDAENRVRVDVPAKQLKLPKGTPAEYVFSFPLTGMQPGIYRIDTLADGVCVWRTFIELQP
ncbi:MAG: serine protease [Bryobacterales bacterium]|nr:serine protease [Bryobacterales bacterium]